MQIALSDEEVQLVRALLQTEVELIRSEVYHAESHDVKELLKAREAIVNRILKALSTS